jgi:hypothetical protein
LEAVLELVDRVVFVASSAFEPLQM